LNAADRLMVAVSTNPDREQEILVLMTGESMEPKGGPRTVT
jgi:hypothetical protein